MRWVLTHGDILDVPADVLVCSANIYLNLSGGVGGEILRRYGDAMQKALHRYLAGRGLRFVERGSVVAAPPCGAPFTAVLHAVAADLGAKRVALTALATGYGRMPMRQFAQAIRPLTRDEFPPVQEVAVCVRHESERDELAAALDGARDAAR